MWDLHPSTGIRNNCASLICAAPFPPFSSQTSQVIIFPHGAGAAVKGLLLPLKAWLLLDFGEGGVGEGAPHGVSLFPLLPAQVIPHKPACVMENGIWDTNNTAWIQPPSPAPNTSSFCHRKWSLCRDSSKPRGETTREKIQCGCGWCLPWSQNDPGAAWG